MKSLLDSQAKRDLKIRLLAAFRANKHDAVFQRLVNVYIHQKLPIILQKLSGEVDDKKLKIHALHSLDWFQFWLTTMTDEQLNLSFPILDNPFHHFNSSKLAEQPFHVIVRNIPVFMWADLASFPISMLLHLAYGKSIRTYSGIVPMSRKMAHIFQNLTYGECKGDGYYVYCIVKLLGGSKAFFKMVFPFINLSGSLEANKNILKKYDVALKKLLEWDTVNILNREQQRRLMGFIDHKLHEMNNFSFKGRTLKSVLQLSEAYYLQQELREQRMQKQQYSDERRQWTASKHQEWNSRYEEDWYAIFELTSAYDLEQESAQMRHCVRSYADNCLNGECRIWSLKRKIQYLDKWVSLVTIEMDQNSQLVQMKAKFNQQPRAEYMKMIKDWKKQENLNLFLYQY